MAAVQPLPGAGVGSLESPPGIQVTLAAPAVAPIPDIPVADHQLWLRELQDRQTSGSRDAISQLKQ